MPAQKPKTKKDATTAKSRESLEKRERLLSYAARLAHLACWELELRNPNANKNSLHWSDEVFRIFGYKPGQIKVTNDNFFKAVHPDDREKIRQAMASAIDQGIDYDIEHRIIRPDGSIRHVREQSSIIFDKEHRPVRMIGVCLDITDQKMTELRLREKEEILAAAQMIARIGSWHIELDGKTPIDDSTLSCSEAACEIFGRKQSRMKAKMFFRCVHPQDREILTELLRKSIHDKMPMEIKHRIKKANGDVCYVKQRTQTILDEAGTPIRIIGTVQDITETTIANQTLARHAHDLERLNQSMVNRELKMIELKKEIAHLKSELAKHRPPTLPPIETKEPLI